MEDELIVFCSEDCLSWEETFQVIDELEADPDFSPAIKRMDPDDHQQTFREYGLTICPSIVYKDEVIHVGPPERDFIKQKVKELNRT